MQANCPKCNHRIVVDDAKAPDRPFNVRCPKCQNAVRFPGKAAAAPPSPPAAPPPAAPLSPPGPAAPTAAEGDKALVALPDGSQAASMAKMLSRAGYEVEHPASPDEGARLLEQGVFSVVVATRTAAPPGQPESLYQRISRLGAEARRKLFLVLVGGEYTTGDGTQAFAVVADLVVNSQDVASIDHVFAAAHGERARMYQTFLETQKRLEAV